MVSTTRIIKNIHTDIKNEKIKRDVNRSYEIVKKVELQNIEYVVYAHRVYHDLDIIVNKYRVKRTSGVYRSWRWERYKGN